jgi:hypothetical protein
MTVFQNQIIWDWVASFLREFCKISRLENEKKIVCVFYFLRHGVLHAIKMCLHLLPCAAGNKKCCRSSSFKLFFTYSSSIIRETDVGSLITLCLILCKVSSHLTS